MEQNNLFPLLREELSEMLKGGFAPVVILLKEFDHNKAGVVMSGLPYNVWSLLGHMRHRQTILLEFLQNPETKQELWPEPYWPENEAPSEEEWNKAIDEFERELDEVREIVIKDPWLFQKNTASWSGYRIAVAILQHNAYHIGQIKAIGRQLGVW